MFHVNTAVQSSLVTFSLCAPSSYLTTLLDGVVCVDGNAHAEGYPQPDGREAVHSQHAAVDDDGHLLPVLSGHSRQFPLLRLIMEFLGITVNTALFSLTSATNNIDGQRDIRSFVNIKHVL